MKKYEQGCVVAAGYKLLVAHGRLVSQDDEQRSAITCKRFCFVGRLSAFGSLPCASMFNDGC